MVMRIKTLRVKRNMTQRELGNLMGVDCTTITKWEAEIALPKARDMPRLARVLCCTIDELYEQQDATAS